MSAPEDTRLGPSRRGFLAAAGGLVAAGAATPIAAAQAASTVPHREPAVEPFWGAHQSGIVTPAQRHTYFAAFDLTAAKPGDVIALLQAWAAAAAAMSRGEPASVDGGDALGLGPSRLTITFGFGPGLFEKAGRDRYGLGARRPAALVDMPRFNGDQLVEARTGGDLSVQACADDPQVVFHAVRTLARLADGIAEIRWGQTGFSSGPKGGGTPRNLMGFKDGTASPLVKAEAGQPVANPRGDAAVWVGPEGPDWMRGGSYVAVRRIRIALEHWDRSPVDFQEQVFGRHKLSGAPLGKTREYDAVPLDAVDKDGNSVVPDTAHVRLAHPSSNGGAEMLRRGYSYNEGVNFTAERWPPWRQGMEYDAGLLFVAYQRDLRTGFVKVFEQMSKLDALNQFTTHVGGGFFACPGGVPEGGFVGEALFTGVDRTRSAMVRKPAGAGITY